MSGFIDDFHFLRPLWLLLLLLPVVGYKHFFAKLKTSSAWVGVCDENLLNYLLVKGSSKQRSLISYLGIIAFIASVIAIAGPTWQKKEVPAYAPENPVMILLNLSSDMEQKDVSPNRLMRAEYNIKDMIEQLGNTQVGLIVYTNEPYLITPFTEDGKIISNLLQAVDTDIMPENGDRLNRAIDLAVEKMKNAEYFKGDIVIFAADVGQDFNSALKSAQAAAKSGYNVNVFEISSTSGEKLRMIAEQGEGIYVSSNSNNQAVSRMVNQIRGQQSEDLKLSQNQQEMWLDYGYYLVIIPLLCCLYFFRRGILVVVFILLTSNSAFAGFFLNDNQEAMKAFSSQDYVTAADKFKDSSWKAAAFYRMGYYDKAYKYYSEKNDPESLYNQGNALAKSGKTEEAIAKYEEVLKVVPEHEDAKFNLEYLKQNQQNQEQNQDKQDNKDQEQNQDQQQNQSQGSDNQQENQDSGEQEQQQNQNQSGDEENEQEKNSQQPQSSDQDEEGESEDENSQQQEEKSATPNEQSEDEKKNLSVDMDDPSDEDGPKYDEEVQAREQQYRDIPEDTGGLLREFIKKEYRKNRYKDDWR